MFSENYTDLSIFTCIYTDRSVYMHKTLNTSSLNKKGEQMKLKSRIAVSAILVALSLASIGQATYASANTTKPVTKGVKKMINVGLFVRLESKPGKEAEVEAFLKGGLAIVQQEPDTNTWFAIRLGPSTFGIFDTFPHEKGRQAHLAGKVASALMAQAPHLLSQAPTIEKVDILASKLP
jgi:quinol monooxygenase YgiN